MSEERRKSGDWDEVNRRILLPRSPGERRAFFYAFGTSPKHAEVYSIFEQLNRNYRVFSDNCDELYVQIDQLYSGKAEASQLFEETQEMYDFRYDLAVLLTRRLANYLASVATLIDVTRRLVDKTGDEGFKKEYEAQVKERFDTPISKFWKLLRQFSQHRALPLVYPVPVLEEHPGNLKGRVLVMMETQDLLVWKKWTSEQRKEIESWSDRDGQFQIQERLAWYCNAQRRFNIWLMERFTEIYPDQLREMNSFLRKFRGQEQTEHS